MYKKEDFEVTIPSKEYLEKSKLIKKIGKGAKTLDGKWIEYWTSACAFINDERKYQVKVSDKGTFEYENEHDKNLGVRPIIISKNLKQILQRSGLAVYKRGIQLIEFGKWYSPQTVDNLKEIRSNQIYYQIDQSQIATEIATQDGTYAILSSDIHKIVPINWYYDEEYDLLLSENILFESPLSENSYYGNFQMTSLYEHLNKQFIMSLLSGINTKAGQIDELNAKIEQLLKENERLKETREKPKVYQKAPNKLEIIGDIK